MKKRHPQGLPESWRSKRHGVVERDNFKGCRIVRWDFESDDPVILLDLNSNRALFNNSFFTPEMKAKLIYEMTHNAPDWLEVTEITDVSL